MRSGKSVEALMARGVDAATATALVAAGHKLANLKTQSLAALRKLGLTETAAKNIRSSSRPPIPPPTLHKLLHDNAHTCCVCRRPELSVIVHHIEDWAQSKSHAAANLTVLCLEDHNKAHSKMGLAQNLTAQMLRRAKRQWEAEVRRFAATALLNISNLDFDCWVYFNHTRLFEMARALEIELTRLPGAASARAYRLIDRDGALAPRDPELDYMYSGGEGGVLFNYVRSVMEAVLAATNIINLSDELARSDARALLAPGDFVFVQGRHTFKAIGKRSRGVGQIVHGVRRANHVRVEFTIDRWEATSTSAWATWLTGTQSVGSLLHLKSIARDGDVVVLQGTAIAVMNGARSMKSRSYEGTHPITRYADEDEDTDDFDFD